MVSPNLATSRSFDAAKSACGTPEPASPNLSVFWFFICTNVRIHATNKNVGVPLSSAPLLGDSPMPILPLAEIAPSPVDWLWPRWLAAGHLHVLDGDPGVGKSTLLGDLAARLSTGRPWPDGAPSPGPASVILLNAEDDAAGTTRSRLAAAGADMARVLAWASRAGRIGPAPAGRPRTAPRRRPPQPAAPDRPRPGPRVPRPLGRLPQRPRHPPRPGPARRPGGRGALRRPPGPTPDEASRRPPPLPRPRLHRPHRRLPPRLARRPPPQKPWPSRPRPHEKQPIRTPPEPRLHPRRMYSSRSA
jgi:hypothetical protein